jgi:HlyD family secretion protein
VWITSKDIGYIKDGDEVRIKVDAFPFQRHGSLRGYVRSITKSSYSSNQTDMGLPHSNGPQTSMHRSIIRLTDTTLDRLPQPNHLIPGMTVSAEIKIGTRSVLSYFIDPLLKGLDESIREP